MAPFDRARGVIARAIADRIFPAAALEVGASAGPLWRDALGTLTFEAGSSPSTLDTPFDLASLTKVIVTTTVLMELVRTGRVSLGAPVGTFFGEWRGAGPGEGAVPDPPQHPAARPPA